MMALKEWTLEKNVAVSKFGWTHVYLKFLGKHYIASDRKEIMPVIPNAEFRERLTQYNWKDAVHNRGETTALQA